MIGHNAGTYIIEESTTNSTWRTIKLSKGSSSTFTNLIPNTRYRYRLHRLMEHGVSRPELSDWFTTYDVDYVPQRVSNVTLVKMEVDKTNVHRLQAEIRFEPADDRSCDYNILSWQEEHILRHLAVRKTPNFHFYLRNLVFDRNTTIYISSVNGDDTRVSNKTTFSFYTFSCMETHHDLKICPPPKITGLDVKDIYKYDKLYDVKINWHKPNQEPDNYTIQLETFDGDRILQIIPGNMSEGHFSDVDLGQRYKVSIIADSTGGSSPITWEMFDSTVPAVIADYTFYYKITIPLIVLMVIATSTMIYIYLRRRKEKLCRMQYSNFQSFNQKEFSTSTSKLLRKNESVSENEKTALPPDKFELSAAKLQLKEILGSGAYGVVKLGLYEDDFGTIIKVAVKGLKDKPSVDDINSFYQEIQIMKSAGKHPNIVSLIGYCTIYDKPLLVVEYCCNGDLQTYLRKVWNNTMNGILDRKPQFTFEKFFRDYENYQSVRTVANRLYDIQQDLNASPMQITAIDLLNFARQIANGMEFLSTNRIVHRDLAARNVLVCSDKVVKISDFGLSRDIYQENVYKKQGSGKLPLKWMAIEALTHQVYTTHSDVWSFGILLWEIVTLGCTPYPGVPTNTILKLLKTGYRMEKPPNCGQEIYDIMYSCWHLRPQSRPTFTELRKSLDALLNSCTTNTYLNLS